MTDQPHRRRALAFNAVAPALKKHDQWLPLSVRKAVAEAVLSAVDSEPAGELAEAEATLARVRAVLDSGDDMVGLDDVRTALNPQGASNV